MRGAGVLVLEARVIWENLRALIDRHECLSYFSESGLKK